MAVNGRVVPAANAFEAIPGSLPLRERIDLAASAPGTSTWVSFGALASDPVRNLPLDGTIDEIRIGTAEAFEEARRDAAEGRYARVDDRTRPRRGGATFTSPLISPRTPVAAGSVAWTVREAPSLPDSAILLEFWDGERWQGPFIDSAGAALSDWPDGARSGPFRWRATFRTGARRDDAVNETPFLDDVTVALATRPRILARGSPPAR